MNMLLLTLFVASAVQICAGKLFVSPQDCQDVQKITNRSGVYTIYPKGTNGVKVRCDMETTGGGWTVIQRRVGNSDFYKTWNDYQVGFGDTETNYWLGNEYIYRITNYGSYELRVDMRSGNETAFAGYNVFFIENAKLGYALFVDGYYGTAGDSLTVHKNYKFSTHDRDNDVNGGSCASLFTGAWWYANCHWSNLNGNYSDTRYAKGPVWEAWKGYYTPMDTTEMKIRRLKNVNTLL